MVGVLILTHGGVAPELLASARVIAGALDNFRALALDWSDGQDEAKNKVSDILHDIDQGEGVLILTDILGGTPSNAARSFCQQGKVEVVAGVNLPMVVRLGCLSKKKLPLGELATFVRDKGRKSICCSSDHPTPPAASGDPCEPTTSPAQAEGS